MSTEATPILYSFRRCPYAMRARLALAVAEVRFELREVSLSAKPQSLLAASPKATVPVLELAEGRVIDESLDIMRWALASRDPEGWLARDDTALVAACDSQFKQDLDRYKYPQRYGSDPVAHRERALLFLSGLDRRLAIAGQLCGPTRGLADAAIFPFVRQFAAVDPPWFERQSLPHLQAWLADHLKSRLFAAIMVRTPFWSAEQAPDR